MSEKYRFDLNFQQHILSSFLTDLEFVRKNRSVIKAEYFDDEILRAICQCALDHYEKKGSLPDHAQLLEELKPSVAPGRKYGEYKEKLHDVYAKPNENNAYYQEKALEFARYQALVLAIAESADFIETGEYDKVEDAVRKALRVGTRTADLVYEFFDETKTRALHYQNKRRGSNTRVPTGISELDSLIQGGLDRGELGMVVAPPKHGKSTALFNIGANAVLFGKVVLHVTLEMSKTMVAARYDSRFFGQSFRDIQKKPKSFLDAMVKLQETLKGRLKIVEFPTKGMKLGDLRAIAQEIPDLGLIIVDYADLIKPPRHRDDNWIELADIYEQLRGLAGELKVPVWTASQSKSSSVGSKVIDIHQIAKSFDKAAIVDLAISLCQTDSESADGKMRLFVMANRMGPGKDQIECKVDWDTAKIESCWEDEAE